MICPNCITVMVFQTRKTGQGERVFLTCPKCGYNVRRNSIEYETRAELDRFEKDKIRINNNNQNNIDEND
jgi:DNA-directed RNA polymerase subunit M/transcription elongation factor TFIIS